MMQSKKGHACPICGRDYGGYCRWDDARVFCYQGNSCHPPTDLNVGQVLKGSDGTDWAFVGYDRGFSGNSALFCIHTPDPRWQHRPRKTRRRGVTQRETRLTGPRKRLTQGVVDRNLPDRLQKAHHLVSGALAAPEFEHCTPDELREWGKVIQSAFDCLAELNPQVRAAVRHDKHYKAVLDSLRSQLKEVSYQLTDYRQFMGNTLCDPAYGKGKRLAESMQPFVMDCHGNFIVLDPSEQPL